MPHVAELSDASSLNLRSGSTKGFVPFAFTLASEPHWQRGAGRGDGDFREGLARRIGILFTMTMRMTTHNEPVEPR